MTDFERKVYRIIFNMTRFGKNPSMEQLKGKTGKDEQAIRDAVKNLMRQRILRVGNIKKPTYWCASSSNL
ncbi:MULTISPECIES: hypothetical protein [unclassified Bacillus (in: firmicutes)]|uniref:hypothetical protein n=1 Tax=unclassified Bacillus (in: firmicutes) TaxID=185979 RepID=UPI0002F4E7BF|nr:MULTISPECIES: hypothetical protein [Bacillus]AIW30973.1 hypothetical protein KO64_14315 [Bacillus subtilis]MBU8887536.1 hypothetical protein [Bacillus sp. FJAT-27001]